MKTFAWVVYAAVMLPASGALALEGKPRIIDADTIETADQHTRLHGIDAPEKDQTCERASGPYHCGWLAAAVLAEMIGDRPAACEATDWNATGGCWLRAERAVAPQQG